MSDATHPLRLSFDDYVLDLPRGSLLQHGREVTLRPKTFAVLAYLAERAGRLVSKEELLGSVWSGLVVTDDTLVQSIGELRRAFAGRDYITTLPRRGYRFDLPAPATKYSPAAARPWSIRWKRAVALPLLLLAGLLAALGAWLARDPAPADARPAIAVLPFKSPGGDVSRAYLADGLTQDIIHSLGRFPALTVMSWNAVSGYQGRTAQPGEISQALGVRYQVEGDVRYAADRARVSAQLVDARGRVLWSARYDEPLADLVQLKDRITGEIAGALAIRVTQFEQQRIAAKPTASFDAYDFLLRARPALQRPTRGGLAEARDLLRRAIALDPAFAAAHSALGETFHIAISMGWAEAPDEYWQRVVEHAGEALRRDAGDVRARILLGRRYIAYNQFDQARAEIDRAIALNPSDADALAGRGNVLVWLGQTEAGVESLEQALRVDPGLNSLDRFVLSLGYFLQGRHAESIEQAELNLRNNADARFSRVMLAAALAGAARTAEAARVSDEIRRTDPTFDATTFGNKFRDGRDLARLRAALAKAGLYSPAG